MSGIGSGGHSTPRPPRAETVLPDAVAATPIAHYQAFGVASDDFAMHLAMFEVRLRTGDRLLFAYHLLGRAEWNPSRGMVLHFGDATVALKGRNLGGFFDAIREHKAAWAQEVDRAAAEFVPQTATVFESITVEFRLELG